MIEAGRYSGSYIGRMVSAEVQVTMDGGLIAQADMMRASLVKL